MKNRQRVLALAVALCAIAVPETVYGQGGVFVPPGSGGLFRRFPQQNTNQNGNAQVLRQLQLQQQQLFNQQALQRSGIGGRSGAVSTTGHPTFFNDLGGYYNSGLNSGGGSIGTGGTTGAPFFNRNFTANPLGGGSGVNVFLGIRR